jgi:hypothetical protein
MPATYVIDAGQELVRTRLRDPLPAADLLALCDALRADPAFRPTHRHLIDARGAIGVALDGAAVRAVVARTPFAADVPRAIVVDRGFAYGLARLYIALLRIASGRSDLSAELFRDVDAAERWLALHGAPAVR